MHFRCLKSLLELLPELPEDWQEHRTPAPTMSDEQDFYACSFDSPIMSDAQDLNPWFLDVYDTYFSIQDDMACIKRLCLKLEQLAAAAQFLDADFEDLFCTSSECREGTMIAEYRRPSKMKEDECEEGWRNPQRELRVLKVHQTFLGSQHYARYEFRSDHEGVCTLRRGILSFPVMDCREIKTGRSSNPYKTLINNGDVKIKHVHVKLEAKSAATEDVGDEVLPNKVSVCYTSMANVLNFYVHCATLDAPISVQQHTEMHSEMPMSKCHFEVMSLSRLLNDGKSARNGDQIPNSHIPNWSKEEMSALLLSKIKVLEDGCGECTTDQGLWGRTPLGKKLEADIAAKGSIARRFNYNSKNEQALYDGSTDSEMEQTETDIDDDGSKDVVSSVSLDDKILSGESSASNEPQSEKTGDNFVSRPSLHSFERWLTSLPTQETRSTPAERSLLEQDHGKSSMHLPVSEILIVLPPSNLDICKEDSVAGDPKEVGTAPDIFLLGDRLMAGGKRTRSRNWSAEEKHDFLELKLKALSSVQGKYSHWDFISQGLHEKHRFPRNSKCCKDLWDTLRGAFRAIRDHELSKSGPQTTKWVSYWEMNEDDRSRNKLPRLFPLEWCTLMERILAVQEERAGKKSRGIPVQESLGDGDDDQYSYLLPADPVGDGSNQQTQGERSCISDWVETPNSWYAGRKGSGAIVEEDAQLVNLHLTPFLKQEVEDEVNFALHSLHCRRRPGSTTKQDELMTSIAPLVKQQVEAAVIYALRCLALTEFIFDEDDPINKLAPFVRRHIKDALNSALQPVSSALQVLEQEEDQESRKAIEENRRALDLEEMHIKRQHVGRHLRTRRTSYKQRGPRVKNSSAGRIIPALKGEITCKKQFPII